MHHDKNYNCYTKSCNIYFLFFNFVKNKPVNERTEELETKKWMLKKDYVHIGVNDTFLKN